MTPGQESVDKYLSAHYPPCRAELDAFKADLRAKILALEAFHNMVWCQDVLVLLDEAQP